MDIRIVSRPIAPPWDSGSMNMAYGISTKLGKRHKVHIPVVKNYHPNQTGIVANPVYSSRDFSFYQKLRLFNYVLAGRRSDILHFFFGPSFLSKAIVSTILGIIKTPSVLTITHVIPPGTKPHLFGTVVVTYSEYFADLLSRMGIQNVIHIPPGIDTTVLHPGINGHHHGREIGLPDNADVILYAGGYSKSDAFIALLDAVEICCKKRENLYFIFACRLRHSDEHLRKEAVSERIRNSGIKKQVIMLDDIPYIHQLIARSNVCVLPLLDTYGKVDIPLFLLEAMAMAKPIVITDIPPLNELLRDPVGFAVPEGDEYALAEAMIEALNNQKKIGTQGRQVVKEKYCLNEIATRYENLYKGLM